MDEDTLIALGFVIGAVILLVIIFVWVIVYCLVCRKQEEAEQVTTLPKANGNHKVQFRYLSTTFNQKDNRPLQEVTVSANSSRSGSSTQARELPQPPKTVDIEESQPSDLVAGNGRPKMVGLTNSSFLASMDNMYAYCDDIPKYPAPPVPEVHTRGSHQHQPSNELLFLERKYNIKADDADDVHNSRPLTTCSNTSSMFIQSPTTPLPTTADTEVESSYDDINCLLRFNSQQDADNPDDYSAGMQSTALQPNRFDLRLYQNSCSTHLPPDSVSSSEQCCSPTGGGDSQKRPREVNSPKPAQRPSETRGSCSADGSLSSTRTGQLQLKEIEEISFDAQKISPVNTMVTRDGVENTTYFTSPDLDDTQTESGENQEPSNRAPILGDSAATTGSLKPTPTPRHSRSTSAGHATLHTDDDELCHDYTNIPPLPKPRSCEVLTCCEG